MAQLMWTIQQGNPSVMKKILMGVVLMLFAGFYASAQINSIKTLAGRWENPDGAGIEVVDSSKLFLVYGKEKKPIISYQADFTRSPALFDFVVQDSARQLAMKSLLLLQNDGSLKWQVFEDGYHRDDFTPGKGDIVILRRKN